MKTYYRNVGPALLGLGLLGLLPACNTLRDRDLLARQEQRREAAELVAPPKASAAANKMYDRTRDGGVALTDDFSTQANRAAAIRRAEKQREAQRHEMRAMKSQHLLPE